MQLMAMAEVCAAREDSLEGEVAKRQLSEDSLSTVDTGSLSAADSEPSAPAADRSIVVLDWDDTLFPTSHIVARCPDVFRQLCDAARCSGWDASRFEVRRECFEECLQAAAALLREAAAHGEVCVVTMAARGWVEACCRVLLPELLGLMKELRIQVVYARETMPQQDVPRSEQESFAFSQACKRLAIEQIFRQMSRQASRDLRAIVRWRSVLSIGDSHAERLALQEVLFRNNVADLALHLRDCHCKTVKLAGRPRLSTVLAQLQLLVASLRGVVGQDDDLDIHFGELAKQSRRTKQKRRS